MYTVLHEHIVCMCTYNYIYEDLCLFNDYCDCGCDTGWENSIDMGMSEWQYCCSRSAATAWSRCP